MDQKIPPSPSFELREGFYSVWSPVTSMLRWSFDFHSHGGYTNGGRAIITLQAADMDCWWEETWWFTSHLILQAAWCRA